MNGNTYDDTNAEIKITQKEINTLVKRGEAVSYKTVMNHETLERLYPGLQNRIKIKFYEGEKTKADTSKTLAMEHSSSKSIPPFSGEKGGGNHNDKGIILCETQHILQGVRRHR